MGFEFRKISEYNMEDAEKKILLGLDIFEKYKNHEKIKIIVPLPPVTKKNHGRIIKVNGKSRMIPSKAFCNYQKAAKPYLEPLGIDYKCNVKCLFYMQTRRIVDLVGLLQAIDDVLAHYGVIVDDNSRIIAGHDGSRVLYDKENPRTEILIERWNDGESS